MGRLRKWHVASGVGLTIAAAVAWAFLPPRLISVPAEALSFDLESEFANGFEKIKHLQGKWGAEAYSGLMADLISKRATAKDRHALVDLIVNDGSGCDPQNRILSEMRPTLIAFLARDGAREDIVRLLAAKCPEYAVCEPLSARLHDLRADREIPEGLNVLFASYDRAGRAAKRRIREVLARDFAYFVQRGITTEAGIVEWARGWYSANGEAVMTDPDVCCSGGKFTSETPVLMPIRSWLDRQFSKSAVWGDRLHPPYGFEMDDWRAERLHDEDSTFVAEQKLWTQEFRASPPLAFSAKVLDAQTALGATPQFLLSKLRCMLQIRWRASAATSEQVAIMPARFEPDSITVWFFGEDWINVAESNPNGGAPAVRVKALPGHEPVGRRVAMILQSAGSPRLPGLDIVSCVKVYPTPAQLQVFTSLSAPPDMVAWGKRGLSLKIVANDATTDDEIRERLLLALKMAAE